MNISGLFIEPLGLKTVRKSEWDQVTNPVTAKISALFVLVTNYRKLTTPTPSDKEKCQKCWLVVVRGLGSPQNRTQDG